MSVARTGDFITLRKMANLIGNSYMRVIPHTEGTIVVDIAEDVFYVVKNTGKIDVNNTGIYEVVMVGLLGRLIELLITKKLEGL